MEIRHSKIEDINRIFEIYAIARDFMKKNGNPTQWKDDRPTKESIIKDLENNTHFSIVENDEIIGVFTFIIGEDPTYKIIYDGNWLNDEKYGVIHKVASAQIRGGIMDDIIEFCSSKVTNIRIDTHKDNIVMQNAVKKHGFIECGIIYVDDGTPRIAYQKIVK